MTKQKSDRLDAVIVGCGFAGMHRLRDELQLDVQGFDGAGGPGGTWWWNRYPGARCDTESVHYSYSFSEEIQREWHWSERYSGQPEILRYLEFVADKLDIRRSYQFDTRVCAAHWDDAERLWTVRTDDGQQLRARFIIAAGGNLSAPKSLDEFPGLERFKGEVYCTSTWPHKKVDFADKRVGVIGTAASGIQVIPEVAKACGHLTVFQRTANYAVPGRNHNVAPEQQRWLAQNSPQLRAKSRLRPMGMPYDLPAPSALAVTPEESRARYDELWRKGGFELLVSSYADLLTDQRANDTLADYIREKIRETVKDPEVAELLCPDDHPYGTKRPPLDNDYYETYNRDNVKLVDVRTAPIQEITQNGVSTGDAEYPLDMIILAVGFDAVTGPLTNLGLVGRGGRKLADVYANGPETYLGIATAGFPNVFSITGPSSAIAFYNNPLGIEDHVDFTVDAIKHLQDAGAETLEADTAAEQAWQAMVNGILQNTLFPKANSWYMGRNVPGKSSQAAYIWAAGAPLYRAMVSDVVARGYAGFSIDDQAAPPVPPMIELDPSVAFVVGATIEQEMKPLEQCTVEEMRAAIEGFVAMQKPVPDSVKVTQASFPTPAGERAVRIFTPAAAPGPLPVIAFFHGGGFVAGSLDGYASPCANLAANAQAVVMVPDYRLAPEATFPAATDDTYAALCWAAENAEQYGGDSQRLIVMGDSAGGNLAAVAAQRARDDVEGPHLLGQVLLYPTIAADAQTESRRRYVHGPILTTAAAERMWAAYLGDADVNSPLASPDRAQSLAGLAPALIISAGCDPMRDEGEAYGRALQAVGVDVRSQRLEGLIHGVFSMSAYVPRAAEIDEAVAAFIEHLRKTSSVAA